MMDKNNYIIQLKNVSKTFSVWDSGQSVSIKNFFRYFSNSNKRKIHSVKNIDLNISKGEFIGIIGANGSGKSTLLNLMAGVYKPDNGGEAHIYGNFIKLSLGLGFNNQLSAKENIYLNASILGLTIREINERFDKIIEFAELQNFVDTKVKYFSRGMRSRLGFAIAINADPEILLLDEIFGGVGDESFKRKSEKAFNEKLISGRTIVLATHSLNILAKHADKVILMHQGNCIMIDEPEVVTEYYISNYGVIDKNNKKNRKKND